MAGIFEKLIDAAVDIRRIDSLEDAAQKQRATLATPELEESTGAQIVDPLHQIAQRGSESPAMPAQATGFSGLTTFHKAALGLGGVVTLFLIISIVRQ